MSSFDTTEEKIMIPSNRVDKITLECFMNRSQYKKYISKTDPTKYVENEEHIQKILRYKDRILDLTSDLLNDPDYQVSLDVNESFDGYVRTLIRYFEIKDMEKDDDDMLFDKIDVNLEEKCELRKEDTMLARKSFWGKEIFKKVG